MRGLIFRLFLLAIIWLGLFVYVFPWNSYGITVPFSWKDYKLWLDLQGWIELDYKVDLDDLEKQPDFTPKKKKEIVEGLKSIIEKRIQTLNINDSEINDASYGWEEHIIVQIPLKWNDSLANKENIERAKEAIGRVVKIVFKEKRPKITQEDLDFRKKIQQDALNELLNSKYNFFVTANKYKDNYEKVAVWTVNSLAELNLTGSYITGKTWIIDELIPWEIDWLGKWKFILDVENKDGKQVINYLFIADTPSEWMPAKDSKWRILNDKYFVKSSVQFNQAFEPMVELTFNDEGAEIFGELTKRLVWKKMAIFVGGQLLTAPVINEPILSWKAVITGNYTPESAKKLSQDINTWVVPAPIYLTSEKSIDSRLGLNSLEKLIYAWVAWFILIFIFLIVVYRLSWLMASIALLMYIMIVLAIIKATWTVLTLASIAGLILSVGMAIDANILIFERVREEIESGKSLEEASKIWFKKSWSAIWDSNVTGLMVALILFVFGINLIKGFWLMLAIGIVVSLFSAMYISRVLVLLLAKTVKNKTLFIGK